MARLDLDVPYHERIAAQARGARWDPHRRCWYVPENVDPAGLLGWSCASDYVNARAHHYYLLEGVQPCTGCGGKSRVHGIVLPTGHEVRLQGEEDLDDGWERSDEPSLLAFVTSLAPSVATRMRQETYCYRARYTFPVPSYHNHCQWCGAMFDDYALYATPGYGFDVLSETEAAAIEVTVVHSGFAGAADHFSYGVAFLDAMRRR
jgi:hypothetical protein